MRVDNAAVGTQVGDVDALTRLRGFKSALRRRWPLLVATLMMGTVAGWMSAPDAAAVEKVERESSRQYYRASHVLIVDDSGSSLNPGPSVNLSQSAYLVGTGEIPQKVADTVGVPLETVRSSVLGLPRDSVQALEVQAVGDDQQLVVRLADAAATELLAVLDADAKATAEAERDEVITELDRVEGELAVLTMQIAADPPNREQLEAQQRSLANQYSLTYEQFSQLAQRPPPTSGLVSLESAKTVSISADEYERARQTIRDGADYVTGVTVPPEELSGTGSAAPDIGASAPTRAAVGGVAGLGLGVGLVLVLDRFDRRLRRREDVEAITGLPVVAEIPPLSRHQQHDLEIVAHTKPRSRAAEAYRLVRRAILFALGADGGERAPGGDAIVLMVTSANPGEGKTTTVVNLAAVLAEGGFNVLIINCDFRRPRVHKYLINSAGSEEPAGEVARFGSVVVTETKIERVRLITGLGEHDADANPLDVVALQRRVIQATRSSFDVILLDTAPFLTTNDASELLSETDQVVVVVRSGKTTADAAARATEILARFDAPTLGVVFNDSAEADEAQYYYYGYNTDRPTKRRRSGDTGSAERSANGGGAGQTASGQANAGPEVNGARTAAGAPRSDGEAKSSASPPVG